MQVVCPKMVNSCCSRKFKRDQDVVKAYHKLEKEVKIGTIIRQLRVLRKLAKEQLGTKSWSNALRCDGVKEYQFCTSSSSYNEEKVMKQKTYRP